ncbi:hypothetical protein D3C80_227860 [compost metagenome]
MRGFDGIERFRQRADLVDLDEDGVGNAHLDTVAQAGGIGDEQIVADQLNLGADLVGQDLPAFPVVFGHAVFDRDDRILASEFGQVFSHGSRFQRAAFTFENVLAILEEFGRGAIEAEEYVFTRLVAGLFDRLDDEVEGFRCTLQTRRKAAFVTNIGVVALCAQFLLQDVEDFRTNPHGILQRFGADRHDHEFLEIDRVVGMCAAIDDVHHRNRQNMCASAADITVKRQASRFGGSLGNGQRHAEDGVCAETRLVRRAVERDHRLVDMDLAFSIETADGIEDFRIDRFNGLLDTLAAKALAAIAQFDSFVGTRRCARRNSGAAHRAVFQIDVDFDGRVATAIEDLASDNIGNSSQGSLLRVKSMQSLKMYHVQ